MNLRKVVRPVILLVVLAVSLGIAQAASALPTFAIQPAAPVASSQPGPSAVEPEAPTALEPDATVWSPDCTPIEVAVYESRLHVRCAQAVNDGGANIFFWAMPASKAQYANRFLSLGSTALVAGRHLAFLYTQGDTSGAAFGCAASDCRNVYAVVLK